MTAPSDPPSNTPTGRSAEDVTFPQTADQPAEPGYMGVNEPPSETLAMERRSTALSADEPERLLSPAAVAGKFLARIDNVLEWIAEGRLRAVQTPRGPRVPLSALDAFTADAYRREHFVGVNHGLHSRPNEPAQNSTLPVPADLPAPEIKDSRWPFPPA